MPNKGNGLFYLSDVQHDDDSDASAGVPCLYWSAMQNAQCMPPAVEDKGTQAELADF